MTERENGSKKGGREGEVNESFIMYLGNKDSVNEQEIIQLLEKYIEKNKFASRKVSLDMIIEP